MTLKNSFWARMKENNKRRIWLWLLSVLSFVIIFPTLTAMTLSRARTSEEYLTASMGEELGRQALYNNMTRDMEVFLGVANPILWILIAVFAVVSAIQGFSYLYNKRKIDFYMGIPVKRNKRFLIIWLNGILAYYLPYIAGVMLSWLVAAGNGVMTASVFKESIQAFGLYLCFYLAVYHLTILAVMLTGNVIITCFGTAVFFLYEWAVREILTGYKDMFFYSFTYQSNELTPIFSPFGILFTYSGKSRALGSLYLFLFAAVIGIIAYICYRNRPAEAAGKAMAFKFPQPFIKIFIAVPVALLSGMITSDIIGYRPLYAQGSAGYVIFVMAIVLIVTCCLIQIIYEFDIKGMFHRKFHILISAAAAAAIFIIFRYDVFGFDSYIPPAENVASVAIITPYEYSYYGGEVYYDEELNNVSKTDYIMENMYVTDVGAVNKLLKMSMEEVEKYGNLSRLFDSEEEGAEWYRVTLIYRMGNKRNVSRSILINVQDPDTVELLDRIEGSEEYICGVYPGASETLDKLLTEENARVSVFYGNNVYQQKISVEEASRLLALYREDIKGTTFSMFRENVNTGSLRLSIEKKKMDYTTYYDTEIRIYPFFTRCVEYLKERGLYRETFIDPEDVERIQVMNYHYELEKQYQEEKELQQIPDAEAALNTGRHMAITESKSEYGAGESDFIRYANYEDEESIKEICDKIYPNSWSSQSWHSSYKRAEDYQVTIYFKSESVMKLGTGAAEGFFFMEDGVPEFVEQDTAYQVPAY